MSSNDHFEMWMLKACKHAHQEDIQRTLSCVDEAMKKKEYADSTYCFMLTEILISTNVAPKWLYDIAHKLGDAVNPRNRLLKKYVLHHVIKQIIYPNLSDRSREIGYLKYFLDQNVTPHVYSNVIWEDDFSMEYYEKFLKLIRWARPRVITELLSDVEEKYRSGYEKIEKLIPLLTSPWLRSEYVKELNNILQVIPETSLSELRNQGLIIISLK